MSVSNREIAKHLSDVSYLYAQDKDMRRSSAYSKAAQTIAQSSPLQFHNNKLATHIPGVGSGIESTINEFAATGTSERLEDLLARGLPPVSTQELTKIPKVGAATARKLWELFGIASLKDFEANIPKLQGTEFGKFIEGFQKVKNSSERVAAYKVKPILNELINPLIEQGYDIGFAGSIRRQRETIRDVDIIVCLHDKPEEQKAKLRAYFEETWGLVPDVRDGEAKWGLSLPFEENFITIDLNFCNPKSRGAYYNYLTGSKEFNIECRSRCKAMGLLLNQEGVFDANGKQIDDGTEEDLFRILKIPYVPPQCREQGAFGKDFSQLIQLDDLIADLHSHSRDSDGGATWEQMIQAANDQDIAMLGISDHSRGSGNGPDGNAKQAITAQFMQFREEGKFGSNILYGAEIDVKADATLDYEDQVIDNLDYFIIAAHHSPEKNLTARYIAAMEAHPDKPKIIAHPTNRKVGTKDSVDADWKKIFEVCKKTNTILEINGQPERQDLPPELARAATESGVYVALNSDCHGINFRRLQAIAVDVAQRGWVMKKHVINANPELLTRWLDGSLYK